MPTLGKRGRQISSGDKFPSTPPLLCLQVLVLEPLLPNLAELHVCGNDIRSLGSKAAAGAGNTAAGEGSGAGDAVDDAPVPGFANLQVRAGGCIGCNGRVGSFGA